MTDLVARLRGNLDDGIKRHPSALKLEAADEIEQLRAKIERWEAQSIAQYAEIQRLRAALGEVVDHLHIALNQAEDSGILDAMDVARAALAGKDTA